MNETVNSAMIVLARESRGHTQAHLATAIRVNRTTLLRYESGLLEVPVDRLRALAEFLDYPVGFFFMQERVYNASCLYHRKRQSIPVKQLKMIHAQVNILRIRATRLLLEAEIESENRFHRLELEKCGSPEEAAKTLRYLWQLPDGPIGSVIGEIERAGGLAFRCPFGTAKVDAISQWPLDAPEMPPVFFVSDQTPGDRQRWTLAHEIGHVVLHHLPTSNPEKEADRFASEFMMPAKDAGPDLRNLTLEKAASLKSWWRVSMAAIIKRAADLGKISERQYRYLFMQLSAAGYRKCEPVAIKAEEPTMFDEIMKVHRADHGRGPHELSGLLNMYESDFLAEFWQSYSGLKLVV